VQPAQPRGSNPWPNSTTCIGVLSTSNRKPPAKGVDPNSRALSRPLRRGGRKCAAKRPARSTPRSIKDNERLRCGVVLNLRRPRPHRSTLGLRRGQAAAKLRAPYSRIRGLACPTARCFGVRRPPQFPLDTDFHRQLHGQLPEPAAIENPHHLEILSCFLSPARYAWWKEN